MKVLNLAKQKPKSQPESFRSVIGRTPQIKLRGGIIASQLAPEQAETVIAAGKFKATCLQLLDRSASGETITITKHGKVVARLVPPQAAEEQPFVPLLGLMKGKGRILGDIVSPDFEAWEMKYPSKPMKKKK